MLNTLDTHTEGHHVSMWFTPTWATSTTNSFYFSLKYSLHMLIVLYKMTTTTVHHTTHLSVCYSVHLLIMHSSDIIVYNHRVSKHSLKYRQWLYTQNTTHCPPFNYPTLLHIYTISLGLIPLQNIPKPPKYLNNLQYYSSKCASWSFC
jgi:hypothetical protein